MQNEEEKEINSFEKKHVTVCAVKIELEENYSHRHFD